MSVDEGAANAYDVLEYPSLVFPHFRPERVAVAAWLHGLEPPPVATGRLLNIGGGDALDTLAFAAQWPEAYGLSFDLAAEPVARGQRWAAAGGLANVELQVLDICEAAEALTGRFDHIQVHGVYAWVPGFVREAILPLVKAKLAPGGVAMVSFNALPGCALRLALRELLQTELAGVDGVVERVERAQTVLAEVAATQPQDTEAQAALRREARRMIDKGIHQLGHDELGDAYHPQRFDDVAAAARAAGLKVLGDIGIGQFGRSFIDTDSGDPQAVFEAAMLRHDLVNLGFFHHLLLVHDDVAPSRRFDPARLASLHASTVLHREGEAGFVGEHQSVEIVDPPLLAFLVDLVEASPGHLPVDRFASDAERLGALLRLWDADVIDLHFGAEGPYATSVPGRPQVHPLVRALLVEGMDRPVLLDNRRAAPVDSGTMSLLMRLDGSRDHAALGAMVREMGADDPDALAGWLAAMTRKRMFVR